MIGSFCKLILLYENHIKLSVNCNAFLVGIQVSLYYMSLMVVVGWLGAWFDVGLDWSGSWMPSKEKHSHKELMMGKLRKAEILHYIPSAAPVLALETTGSEGVSLINSRIRTKNILPSSECVYSRFLWFSQIDNGVTYIRHKTYYGYNMRVHFSAISFFAVITLLDISQHISHIRLRCSVSHFRDENLL